MRSISWTTVLVVLGLLAVGFLTFSSVFLRGLRPPTGSGSVLQPGDTEYAEGIHGYMARPEGAGPFPGVIMVHEWWGLNDYIRDQADVLADQGYLVLAVDLFNGKVAKTPAEAQAQVASLDQAAALRNLKAAAAYLRAQGVSKTGVLGWCFGGGQALQLSMSGVPLDATVIYYGTPLVTDKVKLATIKSPVLGIFGDQDTAIPVAQVDAFGQALAALSISNEFHVYPGVGHAFANPSNPGHASKETKDAWEKTLAFLQKSLKSTATPSS